MAMDATIPGLVLAYPNPDALHECAVQTKPFSAKYGRNVGAVADAVIRSGMNELYGAAHEYFRITCLMRARFFQRPAEVQAQPIRGECGGPVVLPGVCNVVIKTFWFFSWEKLRKVGSPEAAVKGGEVT